MDRYRRIGGWIWVVAGSGVEGVGLAAGWASPGPVTWVLVGDIAALALCSGRQPRWTGKAVAGLFGVYLVAMAASPARHDVVRYAVPVLIGGALLVSATAREHSDHA